MTVNQGQVFEAVPRFKRAFPLNIFVTKLHSKVVVFVFWQHTRSHRKGNVCVK